MLISEIGELALIERLRRLIESEQGKDGDLVVSLGDDAAVFTSKSNLLSVMTTDSLIEDVHFSLSTTTPADLGYKTIAVNLSDIAAMAGIPRYALVSLGLNPKTEIRVIEDFYRGMLKAAAICGLKIIGGDTTSAPVLSINVTIWGQVEPRLLRRRSEAKAGQLIMVTGYLGASSAGLALLQNPSLKGKVKEAAALIKVHQLPIPRLNEARIASQCGAGAMEDISDGLATEILHICHESKVGVRINLSQLPVARGVAAVADLTKKDVNDFVLYGGEDYELIFTANKIDASRIKTEIETVTGTPVALIGEIRSVSERIALIDIEGKTKELVHHGYEHFA